MELREPPRPSATPRPDVLVRGLLVAVLAAILAVGALLLFDPANGSGEDGEQIRELATRLKAAGAVDEAAVQYERYLEGAELEPAERANIAYSLGSTFLDRGDHEKALRWFYEAELHAAGDLEEELGRKVVHTLERLGRFHAAQAALDERVRLADAGGAEVERPASDPVVARIGSEQIYRSDVERALDELPAELAQTIRTPEDRQAFVRQYVADELLWRKARKMEYDRDPEVERQHGAALRRLAIARLIEDQVVAQIQVDEADLQNFFAANKEKYRRPSADGGEAAEPSLDELRPIVERDYRMTKLQSGYQSLVESELAAEEVELFPERMEGAG